MHDQERIASLVRRAKPMAIRFAAFAVDCRRLARDGRSFRREPHAMARHLELSPRHRRHVLDCLCFHQRPFGLANISLTTAGNAPETPRISVKPEQPSRMRIAIVKKIETCVIHSCGSGREIQTGYRIAVRG